MLSLSCITVYWVEYSIQYLVLQESGSKGCPHDDGASSLPRFVLAARQRKAPPHPVCLCLQERAVWLTTYRAVSLPEASPFSKSPSLCPIWFVTCAKQMIWYCLACASA